MTAIKNIYGCCVLAIVLCLLLQYNVYSQTTTLEKSVLYFEYNFSGQEKYHDPFRYFDDFYISASQNSHLNVPIKYRQHSTSLVNWNTYINRNILFDISSIFVDPQKRNKYLLLNLIEEHTSIAFLAFLERKFDNIILYIGYHAFPTTILRDRYARGNPVTLDNFNSPNIILGLIGVSLIYHL